MTPFKVYIRKNDTIQPQIVLITCKTVQKGDELVYDYGKKYWEEENIKKPNQLELSPKYSLPHPWR